MAFQKFLPLEVTSTAPLKFDNPPGKIQPKPAPLVAHPNLTLHDSLFVISIAAAQTTDVPFDLLNVIRLDEGDDVWSDDVPCAEG